MTTKQALESVPILHRTKLEDYSSVIAYANEVGAEMYRNKIRGYLDCMVDMNIITKSARQMLFMWYAVSRVQKIRQHSSQRV